MKNQTQKRAFYVLTGCIAALALCIAAALALDKFNSRFPKEDA